MYTEYQKYLISIILDKDFNARKKRYVLSEFLNSCSSFIYTIQKENQNNTNALFIYDILKKKHKVFQKISYPYFQKWFKVFLKKNSDLEYVENKSKYFQCIESFISNSFSDNSVSSNFGNNQNLTVPSSVGKAKVVTAPLVIENHSVSLNNEVVASQKLENRVVTKQVTTAPLDFDEPPKINLFETKKETTWDILSNQGVPKASLPLTLLSPDDPRYPFSGKCDSVYYDAKGILYDGNSNISLGLNESYPIPINTDIPYDKGKDGYYWYTYSYVDDFNQKNSKNFFPKDFVTFLKTDFMSFSLQYGEKAFISISLT